MLILFLSCSKQSTTMDSSSIIHKSERVSKLKNEINEPSEILDAEFQLFNVNGFSNSRTLVPGASSWDYKFVVKVDPSNIDKWIDDRFSFSNDFKIEWADSLIQLRSDNWKTNSEPDTYMSIDSLVFLIVYRNEGVIFKRVVSD